MQTNPIPWFTTAFDEEDTQRVTDVLASNYINDGDVTREFETRVAERVGVPYAVAVTNGTSAITMALMGLGVGPGDEVLVPDMTFIATANAARLAGATVRLVDITADRISICPKALQTAITPKTKAIIPVDVNGRGADYEFLENFCTEWGLHLVCDSAEAFASKFNGRGLGGFGDAGTFSFSPNKGITTGQGGMILTRSESLYFRLRELKDQGRRFQGTGGDDAHPVIGYNFKLTNVQAAIGLAQLSKVDNRIKAARARDKYYRETLVGTPGIRFFEDQPEEYHIWTDVLVEKRDQVVAALTKEKIGHRCFWHPIHTQGPYKDLNEKFSVATRVSAQGLWLPSYFGLTEEEMQRTVQVIKSALA